MGTIVVWGERAPRLGSALDTRGAATALVVRRRLGLYDRRITVVPARIADVAARPLALLLVEIGDLAVRMRAPLAHDRPESTHISVGFRARKADERRA